MQRQTKKRRLHSSVHKNRALCLREINRSETQAKTAKILTYPRPVGVETTPCVDYILRFIVARDASIKATTVAIRFDAIAMSAYNKYFDPILCRQHKSEFSMMPKRATYEKKMPASHNIKSRSKSSLSKMMKNERMRERKICHKENIVASILT